MTTINYDNIPDNELLSKFVATQNNMWLAILLKRYTLLLFGVALKYLKDEDRAKDIVQQVFLKAITELKKYKVDYFKSWIYKIAVNECLMEIRKNKRHNETDLENVDKPSDDESVAWYELEANKENLYLAIQQLGNEQRKCIELFFLEKKSYDGVAQQTGFSVAQIKSFLQNGKRNLKNLLANKIISSSAS